jgi:phage shock protein PspC (stress-responsive transcriptional regulator)
MARNSHTRRSNNKIIVGVLGGIAKAIGLDPGLVRLMYLFGAFFSAVIPAVIIYLVLWAWMPPPESRDVPE